MRARAFIHVCGPTGGGKTTFIESMLAVAGGFVLAARCVRDDVLRRSRESAPKSDPELRRYREARAAAAARYAFPGSEIETDAFFMTRLMGEYSDAVVLEGDNPLGFADLRVFVAPVPRAREALFVRRERDRAGEERARADAMERLLREPDGVVKLLDQMIGVPIGEYALRNPGLLEETRTKLLEAIAAARRAPPPRPTEHWAITDRYAGIEHAHLVVANIRDASERTRSERLIADVARLRKDETLFSDILGFRGSKVPVMAVVANLTDPGDPGRKKALARVRRTLRANRVMDDAQS